MFRFSFSMDEQSCELIQIRTVIRAFTEFTVTVVNELQFNLAIGNFNKNYFVELQNIMTME